jgi:hypothetical protein
MMIGFLGDLPRNKTRNKGVRAPTKCGFRAAGRDFCILPQLLGQIWGSE